MNLTINDTYITGKVKNEPVCHNNADGILICYFVVEVPSSDYLRADGTRHFSRIERIPVKCVGIVANIAQQVVTQGCSVLITGRIQTTPMTDDQGRHRYSFYLLATFIRVIS